MKLPWVLLLLCLSILGGITTANTERMTSVEVSQSVVMQTLQASSSTAYLSSSQMQPLAKSHSM